MKMVPQIGENVFIAKSADVMGDVIIGENSSVWYQAVIRGTVENEGAPVQIGKRTNIQDGCVLHLDPGHPLSVGDDVTVGHKAILHGCTIGDNCLIGMGAIVMNGAVIGKNSMVGAGALVTQGTAVPEGSLVIGSPAKIKRTLRPAEIEGITKSAEHYVSEARMQQDAERQV